MLYELLTGTVPFEGDSVVAIALRHLSEPPRPPSTIVPTISPNLDAIVMRALEKDPQRRFADADEFLLALEGERERLRRDDGSHTAALAPVAPVSVLPGAGYSHPASYTTQPIGPIGPATGVYGTAPTYWDPNTTGILPPGSIVLPPGSRDRRPVWPWALLGILVAAAAIAALVIVLVHDRTPKTVEIRVPYVVGLSKADAQAILGDDGLLYSESLVPSSHAAGTVISQAPGRSTQVPKGSNVAITISTGPAAPRSAQIPNVIGVNAATATHLLHARGFTVSTAKQSSTTVAKNDVISTSPAVGSSAKKGSTVVMTYSTGPPRVAVPNVVDESLADAKLLLQQRLFAIATVPKTTTSQPAGTVLAQTPASGKAPQGSTVTLTVAKAPAPGDAAAAARAHGGSGERPARQARPGPLAAGRGPPAQAAVQRARDLPAAASLQLCRRGIDGGDRDRELRGSGRPERVDGRNGSDRRDLMRVAVLGGGRSSEHEVSLASAAAVRDGVIAGGHEAIEIVIARDGRWSQDGEELTLRPGRGLLDADVAFPALHGPYGEDGVVQGLLECLDVPYAGSGVAAAALCMDKVRFKALMGVAGLPQVEHRGVDDASWRERGEAILDELEVLGLPVFVKPARLGSSVGIAKARDRGELQAAVTDALRHDSLAIVEAASGGLEVECSVLGEFEPLVSPPGEIVLTDAEFYDYAAKYEDGGMTLVVPARIGERERAEVARIAREAFVAAGCSGLARADFFVEGGGRVLLNELNTMPGFTATSVYAKLWEAGGMSYAELIERLCEIAIERHARERSYLR